MSKTLEVVNSFRDKAIAILRLTKVNTLAEDLQVANASVKSITGSLEETNKKIAEVSSGEFSPSYQDMQTYANAEEARTAVLADLNKNVESLTKQLEEAKKSVTDLTVKINDVASGKKPFSRETITSLSNEMIKSSASLPTLEEIAVVDETNTGDFSAGV